MNPQLTEADLRQIRALGKEPADVSREMDCLRRGTEPVKLVRPCITGDGITALSSTLESEYIQDYASLSASTEIVKFVAASGAASRMFRTQLSMMEGDSHKTLDSEEARGSPVAVESQRFLRDLPRLALYDGLRDVMSRAGLNIDRCISNGSYREILEYLLEPVGLNYSNLPKGLIPFHSYPDGSRTPFEEHLLESLGYLRDRAGVVNIHFTVPAQSLDQIEEHLDRAKARFQPGNVIFQTSLSVQDRATDSICVDGQYRLLRDGAGGLIFRPSGHGALLSNLNDLETDVLFIRTIDNVLPEPEWELVWHYKRILGGCLARLQATIFSCLSKLTSEKEREETIGQAEKILFSDLNRQRCPGYDELPPQGKADVLVKLLNRPLRICGMVKHQGEPGGGPVWIEGPDGFRSIQIVEASQVDMNDEEQRRIWEEGRYFNPADMACGVGDFTGEPFDLMNFHDPDSAFVARKSIGGREVRSLERPGLWNGGMAYWNTVFIEVPRATLRPVKNILDLLPS